MEKYIKFVEATLDDIEKHEAIAEEASEVAQAALKRIRAMGWNRNYTPVTRDESYAKVMEEVGDLLACLLVAGYDIEAVLCYVPHNPKFKRWAERLGYPKK